MIVLSKEQVLSLHEQLIEATGGCPGVRDEGMLSLAAGELNADAMLQWIMRHQI